MRNKLPGKLEQIYCSRGVDYLDKALTDLFKQFADNYCSLLEDSITLETKILAHKLLSLMSGLYYVALQLPEVEVSVDSNDNDWVAENSFREQIINDLGHSLYWVALDPLKNNKTGCGDLRDDLISIYNDLKQYFKLYESNEPAKVREAIWQWRFGFYSHWGEHLVDALKIVHLILEDNREYLV